MELTSSFPSTLDIACLPDTRRGSLGIGSIHQIAWRTPTDESQTGARKEIVKTGLDATLSSTEYAFIRYVLGNLVVFFLR